MRSIKPDLTQKLNEKLYKLEPNDCSFFHAPHRLRSNRSIARTNLPNSSSPWVTNSSIHGKGISKLLEFRRPNPLIHRWPPGTKGLFQHHFGWVPMITVAYTQFLDNLNASSIISSVTLDLRNSAVLCINILRGAMKLRG